MGRWVLVTMLLILSIIVAFGIFVATGVIDGSALFWQVGPKIAWLQPHLETYSHGLDGEAWIGAQEEKLQLYSTELTLREAELEDWSERLEQRAQQLDKQESELHKQVANFQAEQAQRHNVQKLAEIYTEMTPEEGAKILEKLDQSLILDILLSMDMRDAANILTKLPTNLAVALSKELGQASK